MTHNILFFGTSHLGAILEAYRESRETKDGMTFIGVTTPNLERYFNRTVTVSNGMLRLSSPIPCFCHGVDSVDLSAKNHPSFGNAAQIINLELDLRDYDAIVFVDMYFLAPPPFTVDENRLIYRDSQPVSKALISELEYHEFNGKMSCAPLTPDAPRQFVDFKLFFSDIANMFPRLPIYLIPAPRPPSGNIDIAKIYGSVEAAQRTYGFCEDFYREELLKVGVAYLPQPPASLDESGCLTDNRFSKGPHPNRPGLRNRHMNAAYGHIVLNTYLKLIQ